MRSGNFGGKSAGSIDLTIFRFERKGMERSILFTFLFMLPLLFLRAQSDQEEAVKDSVDRVLKESNSGKERLRALDELFEVAPPRHPDSLEKYASIGLEAAKETGDREDSLFFRIQMARVELERSNFSAALQGYLEVARKAESIRDTGLMTMSYTGAAHALRRNGQILKSRSYYEKGLELKRAIGDSSGIAGAYNNLGITYMIRGAHDTGMSMWKNAVDLKLRLGDSLGATNTMMNIAKHYRHLEKYDEAESYLERAIRIHRKYDDPNGEALDHLTLSRVLREQGKHERALEEAKKGLRIAEDTESKSLMAEAYQKLYRVTARMDDHRKAFHYHKEFKAVQDSIRAEQKRDRLAEIEAKYQNEKKQLRIEKQEARLAAERRQKLVIAGGLVSVVILALLILRNYLQKRKDNRIISEEKEKVEEQKALIQEKNEEIMDSIDYSQRLQEAILPDRDSVRKALPGSFVLFLPKEAVSGDFYWLVHLEDRVIFAAADCTGHGVPGAMVSMVCYNALQRAVKEFGIVEPGKILEKADELVMETFETEEQDVKDGMDIALCSLKPEEGRVSFAGANNPLYHIRGAREGDEEGGSHLLTQGELTLEEIKADKQAIGRGSQKAAFNQVEVPVEEGDGLYLFSDGYADQFGGPKGKKFKYKPFKRLLLEHFHRSPQEQRSILAERMKEWKGELEQVDDICVIGVKVGEQGEP